MWNILSDHSVNNVYVELMLNNLLCCTCCEYQTTVEKQTLERLPNKCMPNVLNSE